MAIATGDLLAAFETGETAGQIAARFGVTYQRICQLIKLRTGRSVREHRPRSCPRCATPLRLPTHAVTHANVLRERREAKRVERFWARVDKTGECWEWMGARSNGYGQTGRGSAHRAAYMLTKGPIPVGLELDHLCRNRGCVNPAHLEVVSHRENVMRSPIAPPALNARKTHCVRGHALPIGPEDRVCRQCQRSRADPTSNERSRRYRARKAAEKSH
jgi:hypothetical protein